MGWLVWGMRCLGWYGVVLCLFLSWLTLYKHRQHPEWDPPSFALPLIGFGLLWVLLWTGE